MGTLEADYLQALATGSGYRLWLQALSPEKPLLFPIDHTHTSAVGAKMNAKMVAIAHIKANAPVAAYLK